MFRTLIQPLIKTKLETSLQQVKWIFLPYYIQISIFIAIFHTVEIDNETVGEETATAQVDLDNDIISDVSTVYTDEEETEDIEEFDPLALTNSFDNKLAET